MNAPSKVRLHNTLGLLRPFIVHQVYIMRSSWCASRSWGCGRLGDCVDSDGLSKTRSIEAEWKRMDLVREKRLGRILDRDFDGIAAVFNWICRTFAVQGLDLRVTRALDK